MLLNYLKNMWNGNIRLVILFWVYYTIISSILNELFFSKLDEYNNGPFIIILIFLYLYSFFMNKSLWSSCNKYTGKKIWIVTTRIIIVLDLFSLIILLPLRLLGIEIF